MASVATGSPEEVKLQYLWTVAELEENALMKLGPMDEGTYEDFVERMRNAARILEIAHPKMGIGIQFKVGAHPVLTEKTSLITEDQWPVIIQNAAKKCVRMPKVFVIDGSKFTLPV